MEVLPQSNYRNNRQDKVLRMNVCHRGTSGVQKVYSASFEQFVHEMWFYNITTMFGVGWSKGSWGF